MKKIVMIGISMMIGLGLIQRAGALDNETPVSYDYTGRADPAGPDYAVSIPTGLVFDAKNVDNAIDLTVKLVPAQGETVIKGDCKVEVSVASENGYKVQLATGVDEIAYRVNYGGTVLTGKTSTKIGTLVKDLATPANDVEAIVGDAKLLGVATKTGNHTDKLVYTIVDIT